MTKVQYPGVAEAVQADLANAEMFAPLARMFSPNLKIRPLMEELRERLVDELDYQQEALYQQAFFERYDGHPFIRVPQVYPGLVPPPGADHRVHRGTVVRRRWSPRPRTTSSKRRYGEIIYRFVFGSLNRFRLFNGDPHPGQLPVPRRRHRRVPGLRQRQDVPLRDAGAAARRRWTRSCDGDVDRAGRAACATPASCATAQDVDGDRLLEMFRLFNQPVLDDAEYTYTREFAEEVIRAAAIPRPGYWELLRKLNLPPDYLLLNRIQWGVNSILARLGARANWHRIALELMGEGPPATPLGEEEAAFIAASPFLA